MKYFYFIHRILLFIILLQGFCANVGAQIVGGKDFWLTFGKRQNDYASDMQIRIVSGDNATTGAIYFTHLGTSVTFSLAKRQVYTYSLSNAERAAVYSTSPGVSSRSVRITSNQIITVYILDQTNCSTEATPVFSVENLGTDYYNLSYTTFGSYLDAYTVVGTTGNTKLYHNGNLAATINAGQVFYKTSDSDMSGAHITADHPVAFFSVSQGPQIPVGYEAVDCLLEQFAPVDSFGKNFFVPVSVLTRDIVRIVASQNNTNITQTGGKLLYPAGGQTSLNNLQAGQFVELEVSSNNKGCYIQSDKPVGVCDYLTSNEYNKSATITIGSDPSLCWLPPVEKTFFRTLIAPFVPKTPTRINRHYALITTPTKTKNGTTVVIGESTASTLSGGAWIDHPQAGMSFYNMPLTEPAASYIFTNSAGLFVMCYGCGDGESYFYNTTAVIMEDFEATFFVNNIHYQDLQTHTLCSGDVTFNAQIIGMSADPGSLKWYIDDIEETTARDKLEWSNYFLNGDYKITMKARFSNEDSVILESPLHISDYRISATVSPPEGGSVEGDGCYKMNEKAILKAIPEVGYYFINWTESDTLVSTEALYPLIVTASRNLVAHFAIKTYDVILSADPPEWGAVAGEVTAVPHGTSVTVTATPNDTCKFLNWTENGVVVSSHAAYTFEITADRKLVAHFAIKTYDITVAANPTEGGTVTGGTTNIPHGTNHTVTAKAANEYYAFVNWTENDTEISTDNSYSFIVTDSRALVANFVKAIYNVNIKVNNPDYGYTTGSGAYDALTSVQVEAFANSCYPFINWTIDSVEVSTKNPYVFEINNHVNLVANFLALDFDTCALTLWNNTFLLNLKWLRENGYHVTGCRWFKNGIELEETNAINEFSYSAGPKREHLEPAPSYYTFELSTSNFGQLCSSRKLIAYSSSASTGTLLVYPNPVGAGIPFSIEGVGEESLINVYNFLGVCVGSATATNGTAKLTLNVPAGIYFIRTDNREAKIVIVE